MSKKKKVPTDVQAEAQLKKIFEEAFLSGTSLSSPELFKQTIRALDVLAEYRRNELVRGKREGGGE